MNELFNLRKLSLNFRRVSSNFLNSDRDNADVNLVRLMKFIEDNSLLHDTIHNIIDHIDFEFTNCFRSDDYGHTGIDTPVDECEHLKAQYDYAYYIINDSKHSVPNETLRYTRSYSNDKVREFISDAFKPMIDYLNDAISTEIIMAEETRPVTPSVVQRIEHNYGTANAQGSGTITSSNTTNPSAGEIITLLENLIPSLDITTDIPQEEIDSVKDDMESIIEQMHSPSPRKSRLQKAVNGIRKFASDFSMKLAVNMAAKSISEVDWDDTIAKIELFISTLNFQ